jgi:hypothetical protein
MAALGQKPRPWLELGGNLENKVDFSATLFFLSRI